MGVTTNGMSTRMIGGTDGDGSRVPNEDMGVNAIQPGEWLLELLVEAERVNAAIESDQMGTTGHDDLKQLLLRKQA